MGQQCECDDIYLNDSIVSLRIARGKRSVVAQSGVIDQEIDADCVLLEPTNQFVDLRFVAKIDNTDMNVQVRVSISQFVAQLIQSLLASRDQNERSRACRQLVGKVAPDASRCAGEERATYGDFHSFALS